MVSRFRKIIQAGWGILTNGYAAGFLPGGPTLYSGPLKHFCVPGMNCYSCPGALGACPIGAVQAILDGRHRGFPFYVLGYLAMAGLLAGRFICGWLCLFGLIQELLYRIPTPKIRVPDRADRILRYLKYVVLAVLVIGIPLVYRTDFGMGVPAFCKYLCPVGTLEGGIPMAILQDSLRATLGALFRWKVFLLILCVLASVFIHRPFCKYICPLGALYSLFQKVSLVRMNVDTGVCIDCGACGEACPMNVVPCREPNSPECIRCGECTEVCPVKALSFRPAGKRKNCKEEMSG